MDIMTAGKNGFGLNGSAVNDLSRSRYSAEELEEFKGVIVEKREKAQLSYEMCKSSLTHSGGNDIQDTSPTFKVLEEGEATLSKEEAGRLAAHHKKYIEHLDAALFRIGNNTYGYCNCDQCKGKRINKERLLSVPHATTCIEEKNRQSPPPRVMTFAR